MKILITGGSGYIASNLVAALASGGHSIRRLGRSLPSPMVLPHECGEFVLGDVREREVWERVLPGVDVVYHLAAQTSVYVAENDPRADFDANVLPVMHLLEVCRQRSLRPRVILAGTVTECGVPTTLPVNESHPDQPVTHYDLHKLMAEKCLELHVRMGVVTGGCLRLSNVYGPGPRSSSGDRGVLNMMIRRALEGQELTVYGAGDCIRDYVYVDDVARAFVLAAEKAETFQGRHFVIGSGVGYTLAQAINLVADRVELSTGRRVPVRHVDTPMNWSPIEIRNFVADTTAYSAATGWTSTRTLAEGLDRTIASINVPIDAASFRKA